AHIASLLGLDETYLQNVGVSVQQIKGVVGLAGPYAFYPSKTETIAPVFAALADENVARPIMFVDGSEPPFLLLHGKTDTVVYKDNSEQLAKAMMAAGGSVETIYYPEVDHIGIVLGLSLSPFRPDEPILTDIKTFIDGKLATTTLSR
ncbi:MAG: prolyl oligopeptidase family serine peptidase, partial [Kordiimonadaceae bacterium]|nr:prolyl oligopeptidase family serine peptidase [Kordiimonadaceae bacterium]